MKVKKILWGVFAVLLFLPLVQYNLNPFTLLKLVGYYEPAEDITFTKHDWWEGNYQEQKSKYINDHVGFRPDLVRISNQIDFSFFNLVHSNSTLGKDNYLIYDNYIDAYFGKDFLGHEYIAEVTGKMKYLEEEFSREGKTFVLVIAASKADYFPEFLPDRPGDVMGPYTNRTVFKHYCDSLGIKCIDFNDYYKELKKTKQSIFTKLGIHWSVYGAMFAVDSLFKFVERERNLDLPNPEWTVIETTEGKDPDNDIAGSLNLIFPIPDNYKYPVVVFHNDTLKDKPSAVYIGDSFTWMLMKDSIARMHHEWDFWHYFKDVYHNNEYIGEGIAGYDWKSVLDKTDCVFLLFTPMNLHFVDDFVNPAYEYYKEKEQERKGKVKNAVVRKE